MINKLAKLKFLPNNFEIIEEGDHVICSISNYFNNSNSYFKNDH